MKPGDHDGTYKSTVDGKGMLDGSLEISGDYTSFWYNFDNNTSSKEVFPEGTKGVDIEFTLKINNKPYEFRGKFFYGIKRRFKGTVHFPGRPKQDPTWTAST